MFLLDLRNIIRNKYTPVVRGAGTALNVTPRSVVVYHWFPTSRHHLVILPLVIVIIILSHLSYACRPSLFLSCYLQKSNWLTRCFLQLLLSCGIENAILTVQELEKCEYQITGTTPALCLPVGEKKGRDEL